MAHHLAQALNRASLAGVIKTSCDRQTLSESLACQARLTFNFAQAQTVYNQTLSPERAYVGTYCSTQR